ncbi:hypothetical protein JCGZ_02172 [Jatropha curcas]|uniref:XS domain-containing protein n=1 Tax=Jatropha curcas TaxID=180498 RepID=A0A067L7X0_JATCU|nr:uncharacterized protein LOC105631986 [Jatropha curcas]KDP40174.1 hypothetical protein JCGZ_02172 [Jatropha curcas]
MAGGGNHKSSFDKPSSSSASHRKSRWESSATANNNNPSSNSKSNDLKPSKPTSNTNPSPKLNTGPSPKPTAATPPTGSVAALQGPSFHLPDLGPPPPPAYGFHMLERRTIVLADGSVRSYFALPPDYQDFPPRPMLPPRFLPMGPTPDLPNSIGGPRFPPMSPEGLGFRDNSNGRNASMKRKYVGGEEEFRHGNNTNGLYPAGKDHRSVFLAGPSSPFGRNSGDEPRAGKYMRIAGDNVGAVNKYLEVDQTKLKKAFLHYAKVINETEAERKRYLEDGKQGRLHCVACGRSSKDFSDMHALVMHTYNSDNADLRVDHLGLHKALCVLMGWNYSKPPDNAKAYQFLPADEAAANQEDLIMWPPTVIIHNTVTGKGKDGRMEGLGNKAMDIKIRDLGCFGGKSKSLYGRDGHLGITLIKFSGDQVGLKEALRLAEHFEKENHGHKAWERIQPMSLGKDDEKNPNLVQVERSGEKKRILYGYLGTAADLYKIDFETKKKVIIESQSELKSSK